MSRLIVIAITACLLAGCQGGGMKVLSATQEEKIALSYQESRDVREVFGVSTSGESFSGTLRWTSGDRSDGSYSGVLVGENGRSLQVSFRCNAQRRACAGTAKDSDGEVYFVF